MLNFCALVENDDSINQRGKHEQGSGIAGVERCGALLYCASAHDNPMAC